MLISEERGKVMGRRPFFNYIGGEWKPCSSGELLTSTNPADTSEVVGEVQASSREDVLEAISCAHDAFDSWKRTTVTQRAECLKNVFSALIERREEIARLVTLENGKTLGESLSEVDSALREMEFQIGEGVRAFGETVPSARPGVFAFTRREPLGVVAVITPWNFPVNVAFRKLTPALMAGNSAIFKPSSFTSVVGARVAELLAEAGFPEGVFNFVTGAGATVGRALASSPTIKAVSFTGSTEVGLEIEKLAAANNSRVQLEMGGKNPIVVLADASIEMAAKAAARAAFACAGQWCTSTSRAIVEESAAAAFTERVLEETRALRVGPGMDESSTMGPVAGESQLRTVLAYIERGRDEGATLLAGGERLVEGELHKGCFIAPTVFADVTPDMEIATEEIFGPVLSIIRVKDFDEAVRIANDVRYGLSSSIYTRDFSKAWRFVEETDVGLTHVNMFTAYKEPALPFGGIKDSGTSIPEAGKSGIEFFSARKAVYMNYGVDD